MIFYMDASRLLKEHFGPVVSQVGHVLLQRGRLRMQDLLSYVGITFCELRNAMLVLLQHGLMSCESLSEESYVQLYRMEMQEILSRLRFPQYLEHVAASYGSKGVELLLVALKYGRVSRPQLLGEAAEAANVEVKDLEELLLQLVKDRILRPDDARRDRKRKREEEEAVTEARNGFQKLFRSSLEAL